LIVKPFTNMFIMARSSRVDEEHCSVPLL